MKYYSETQIKPLLEALEDCTGGDLNSGEGIYKAEIAQEALTKFRKETAREARVFWIGFSGNPEHDKLMQKRTVSGKKFEPVDFNDEVIRVVEFPEDKT